jgi:Domain of unknown function (DUF4249)
MKRVGTKFVFILVVFICFQTLFSCQKEVHIDLGSSPPVLVVEGQIQTGQPPIVVLTTTLSFFANIDFNTLQGFFVTNAVVTVSDGTKTVTLKQYTIDTGVNNKVYVYTLDTLGRNPANLMLGEVGKYYTLKISYNGSTYVGVTKIPVPKGVDTMWFDRPVFPGKHTPDSAKMMFVAYTDPDTPGNFVRAYTRRNRDNFYPTAIYSDQAVNGIRVSPIGVNAGFLDTANVQGDTVRFFYPGDTVTINWCQIDRGVYNFWNTENYANQILGNPFSSPINLITNMNNGAIGVWAGYSSATKTMIVP